MVELVIRVADGLNGGYQHRHIFGLAAGHYRVDNELFGGNDPVPLRDLTQDLFGLHGIPGNP